MNNQQFWDLRIRFLEKDLERAEMMLKYSECGRLAYYNPSDAHLANLSKIAYQLVVLTRESTELRARLFKAESEDKD